MLLYHVLLFIALLPLMKACIPGVRASFAMAVTLQGEIVLAVVDFDAGNGTPTNTNLSFRQTGNNSREHVKIRNGDDVHFVRDIFWYLTLYPPLPLQTITTITEKCFSTETTQ